MKTRSKRQYIISLLEQGEGSGKISSTQRTKVIRCLQGREYLPGFNRLLRIHANPDCLMLVSGGMTNNCGCGELNAEIWDFVLHVERSTKPMHPATEVWCH